MGDLSKTVHVPDCINFYIIIDVRTASSISLKLPHRIEIIP